MFSARLKALARTLRFRLMAWNAAVVALAAIVILVGMQVGVRRALVHEMDQFLAGGLKDLSDTLESSSGDLLSNGPLESGPRRLHFGQQSAMVATESGQVLWSSDDEMRDLVVRPDVVDSQPTSVDGYRLVQRQVRTTDGELLVARVGIPLSVIESDIQRVDTLALTYAGTMLAVAPLVGFWLAGRVVSPLRDLIRRTSLLRPTKKRDDRLPIRGGGDELDQLAGTINSLLDRITSYLHHREDFVANAAHELRNPVAAIRSTAEVALGSERSREEYENLIEEMIEECARLEILVNQLLLLSESDANRLRFHETTLDISEIVQHAAATFGPAAESLDIRLDVVSAPVMIDGNRHHLQQVVSNLLDNALKFTAPGGRISVSLTADREEGVAVLVVRDTGIGIQEHDIPQIFERFYRGDKSRVHDTLNDGAGLGLSICRSIVEAHGGSISVESCLGNGSTFTVRLPAARRRM